MRTALFILQITAISMCALAGNWTLGGVMWGVTIREAAIATGIAVALSVVFYSGALFALLHYGHF